ncbi:UNVERIFIED_CONTAM: tpiA [Trichonephila clavipes]
MTGELATSQLVDGGCELVLVGHSERRLILGESDEVVVGKFAAVQKAGLIPVLCLGETREQRETNATLGVVGGQLAAVIDALGVESLKRAVVAYEPVWAIGTGLTATPEQAQEVHAAIRAQVAQLDAEHTTTGDAIIAALQVLMALKRRQQTLVEARSDLKKCPQVLVNVRLSGAVDPLEHPSVKDACARVTEQMAGRGRVLLRKSGTEPLVRVMVEGDEESSVRGYADELAKIVAEVCA